MKVCTKCDEAKPLDDFYKRPKNADGRFSDCKVCVLRSRRERYEKDGDVLRERVRRYQAENPEKVRALRSQRVNNPSRNRASQLKKYGLTVETFDALLASQDHRCAICRSDDSGRFWAVDHDHVSGDVRGILCWHCNVALGHFRDDVSSLIAAADYLLRARARSDVA